MRDLTLEQHIYDDFNRIKRKYRGQQRSLPEGDIRLTLARKYKMSCKQIRVIVATERLMDATRDAALLVEQSNHMHNLYKKWRRHAYI